MTGSIWIVRKKDKYVEETEYTEEEFFRYKNRADSIAAAYNLSDAIPLARWLRRNGWLNEGTELNREAMGKIRRMSEGAYEVVEKYVDDKYRG